MRNEIESAYIQFIDPQTGWISFKLHSSSNFSFGRLLATVDGGSTWQERSLPLGEQVEFLDANHGWVKGGPLEETYTTEDGGESWSISERLYTEQSKGLESRPNQNQGIIGQNSSVELPIGVVALDMLDMQQGWAVVHEGSCRGYKPRAGEKVPQGLPPLQCESSSQLLMTTDGGKNWHDISPP